MHAIYLSHCRTKACISTFFTLSLCSAACLAAGDDSWGCSLSHFRPTSATRRNHRRVTSHNFSSTLLNGLTGACKAFYHRVPDRDRVARSFRRLAIIPSLHTLVRVSRSLATSLPVKSARAICAHLWHLPLMNCPAGPRYQVPRPATPDGVPCSHRQINIAI